MLAGVLKKVKKGTFQLATSTKTIPEAKIAKPKVEKEKTKKPEVLKSEKPAKKEAKTEEPL